MHKGDLLVEFRADEVQASLREAHDRADRGRGGPPRSSRSGSGLDRLLPATRASRRSRRTPREIRLTAASARRDAAQAAVDRLEAEAAKYRILAPIDGVVIARHADPGETVSAAAPLVTIVDLTRLRVEAEVDEFDIPGVTLGRRRRRSPPRDIAGRRWRGQVEEIADAVVARQTRPEDPGRPADTRVLLVKIAFREPNPLKLGQRVEVEIGKK